MHRTVKTHLSETVAALSDLYKNPQFHDVIVDIAHMCQHVLESGRCIWLAGSDLSAWHSRWFAAELEFILPADVYASQIAILEDLPLNETNTMYRDDAMSERLSQEAHSGDLLIAIHVLGESEALKRAIAVARNKTMPVIGMTGQVSQEISKLCDKIFSAPAVQPFSVRECHGVVIDLICALLLESLPSHLRKQGRIAV